VSRGEGAYLVGVPVEHDARPVEEEIRAQGRVILEEDSRREGGFLSQSRVFAEGVLNQLVQARVFGIGK
jgi:hypothetical protein